MAFSEAQQFFINQLRSDLSMRYTVASGSSYILPAKLGDMELWEDLRQGLNLFNTYPPIITTFTCQDLYDASAQASQSGGDPFAPENESSQSVLLSAVIMCAEFFSGLRLQWFEAGKHFRYNDNGISIERVKQPDYQNIVGANILAWMNSVLPGLRKTMAFERVHVKGLWSGIVSMPRSLTKGLRGTRLGMGG